MKTNSTARLLATTSAVAICGALLTACGQGSSDEPDADRSAEPTATVEPTEGPVEHTELDTFSPSRLRMEEGTVTPLDSEGAAAAWLPGRAPKDLVSSVDDAAAGAGDGTQAYGLVLAVGCDAPEGYSLHRVEGDLTVRVEKSLSTTQCLVPTTWLAVVSVDETS